MKTLAVILTVALVTPSAFLAVPQKVHALAVTEVGPNLYTNIKTTIESTLDVIQNTISATANVTSAAAEVAMWINVEILQPLAFIMSGNLLKLLTASVLDFVIGKINGTGAPQFVQDLNGNLQRVGDIRANAFFMQFNRNMNSPFSYAISSSLRTNYLQNTSSAGFFAANRCPFYSSPNANGFLSGDWSKGGTSAWFAVTTQTSCNPYTLYQASQSHLASIVGSAVSARLAELNWGDGFLSWCGPAEMATTDEGDGTAMEGNAPGDFCTNADGTPGTIKTPGSTIKATLDKVLGSTQDKLVQMGAIGKEIGGILSNVATVLGTVQFASQILGGPNSGGLFGVGQTSGTNNTSRLLQYQSPGYLGVTPSTIYKNAANLPISGPEMLSRVAQYESSWSTIRSAANSASTTVASLASFCDSAAETQTDNASFLSASAAQAVEARSAITTQVAPIFAQANAASAVIASARAMVQKIQSELNSSVEGAGAAYSADIQALQSIPPTALDLANVMQEVQSFNMASAVPAGSLKVSGGTIIDRMALISTNAEALKTSVCTEQARANSGGDVGD